MGSTRKFGKDRGSDSAADPIRLTYLACGCSTDDEPTIAAPVRKWFCCGEYRRARPKSTILPSAGLSAVQRGGGADRGEG
jgi:hypothetical protein